ncbi:MAG: sigma 54-interacting transcriptional regulator [Planctomycetota bacterium]
MPLFRDDERALAEGIREVMYANPFLPERIEGERHALGEAFAEESADWNRLPELADDPGNLQVILERSDKLTPELAKRLRKPEHGATSQELALYEDLVVFGLYHSSRSVLDQVIERSVAERKPLPVKAYGDFAGSAEQLLAIPGIELPSNYEFGHLFAAFFQVRRAFHHIFSFIVGSSPAASRLRAAVWQSIFTHDLRRYRQVLYNCMGDITTLVTGPSGTGKELVARAIGLSRYVPFDAKTCTFSDDFVQSFYPLNLSALSPTLIESELFGHCRGTFTGAVDDHAGWFEVCPARGTVFLDEIGELAASIQVKLLRVLQSRTFQRLGETKAREFRGKVIAATNRDLAVEMQENRFREDLYYRLCSDVIVTPSLRDHLRESPDELQTLVNFIAERLIGNEGPGLADEVLSWINAGHLGADYAWPGNFRELEQCVRNILIRSEYRPAVRASSGSNGLTSALDEGTLTADELLRHYCTRVYLRTGSYEAAARQLGLDRRTVKAKIDDQLLEELRNG